MKILLQFILAENPHKMIPCLRLDSLVLDSSTLELPGAELEARAAQDGWDKATVREGRAELDEG